MCTDLFSVQPDGTIRHHPGGWSDWREHQRQQRQRPTPAPDTPRDQRPATRVRKLTYGERRELTTIERRLPQLHQRSQELTRALQAAGDDYRAAEETGDELAKVLQEIDAAETRWLELSEIGETA